ncbi:hypothetical protein [Deinococcus multiflagellatus]|uniref:Uncharacterized protein n=1 Tax=Deinococcus multiflagellatus TaxID=1656887 RepID=A0ABW1ZLS8_9DEIO
MSAPTFEPLGDAALVVRTPAARALLARLWRQPPPACWTPPPRWGRSRCCLTPCTPTLRGWNRWCVARTAP